MQFSSCWSGWQGHFIGRVSGFEITWFGDQAAIIMEGWEGCCAGRLSLDESHSNIVPITRETGRGGGEEVASSKQGKHFRNCHWGSSQ